MKGLSVRPTATGILVSPEALGEAVQSESFGISVLPENYGGMADGKKGSTSGYASYWAWGNGEFVLWASGTEIDL